VLLVPEANMSARSFLFVPGNRPERFAKALQSGADAVVIDLEDAVPAPAKLEARATVAGWLSAEHPVYVRVNAHGTEWHDEDVQAMAHCAGLRGLLLPKAQDPLWVAELAAQLTGSASVLPVVETAQGLWSALEIARCPRVERLGFGHLDFQRDLGIDGENEEILFARSQLVFTSRLAGVGAPLDGITAGLDDEEKLRADVERARRLGFGGKLCIHPKQVQAVNSGFLPSEKDVEWARQVVAAAEAAGGGAVRMGAEMVDAPVVARARNILRLAPPQGPGATPTAR
jgi:citrate lyase subunit beta / citryl-CoA lyase